MRKREILNKVGAVELALFIANSYKKKKEQLQELCGFIRDDILSNSTTSIYKDQHSPLALVIHRGTKTTRDLGTDIAVAFGFAKWTTRVRCALVVQKIAVRKYGRKNIVTIGHSLGGKVAEIVGVKGKLILTYNKAVSYESMFHSPSNQKDIRSKFDIVSGLGIFHNQITIPSSVNPLEAHSTRPLETYASEANLLLRQQSSDSSDLLSSTGSIESE